MYQKAPTVGSRWGKQTEWKTQLENHRLGKWGSLSVAQHILPVSGKLLAHAWGLADRLSRDDSGIQNNFLKGSLFRSPRSEGIWSQSAHPGSSGIDRSGG
ncbi:hypothetical protein SYN65AY6LI_11820 [Synechococcus sp. 65AY6Li]|jgi:hypothetical protein|nr:hypothetical protein SYN65AY6LI_11820 [Synechococcus sp. 65AY6Li]